MEPAKLPQNIESTDNNLSESPPKRMRLGRLIWSTFVAIFGLAISVSYKTIKNSLNSNPDIATTTAVVVIGLLLLTWLLILWLPKRFTKIKLIVNWFKAKPADIPSIDKLLTAKGATPYRCGEELPQRKREIRQLLEKTREQRFIVLSGQVGSGKTSLLDAGLKRFCLDEFDMHISRVGTDLDTYLSVLISDKEISRQTKPKLLCIDQFDEIFPTFQENYRIEVIRNISKLVSESNIRVIIAIRSDFIDLLGELCRLVDPEKKTIDSSNPFLLNLLSLEQARHALQEILSPISNIDLKRSYEVEKFITKVIHELARPADLRKYDPTMVVSPLDMQIVIDMMITVGQFNLASLTSRGNTKGLLSSYVDHHLASLPLPSQVTIDDVISILCDLVTPSGTRRIRTTAEICRALEGRVSEQDIRDILNSLRKGRLVIAKSTDTYELVHDWVARAVIDKKERTIEVESAREERRRQIFARVRIAAISTSIILLSTACGWYAYSLTDRYQISQMRANSRIDRAAAESAYDAVAKWILSLPVRDDQLLATEIGKIENPKNRFHVLMRYVKELDKLTKADHPHVVSRRRLVGDALRLAMRAIENTSDDENVEQYRLNCLLIVVNLANKTQQYDVLTNSSTGVLKMILTMAKQDTFLDWISKIQRRSYDEFREEYRDVDRIATVALVLAREASPEEAESMFLKVVRTVSAQEHEELLIGYTETNIVPSRIVPSLRKGIREFVSQGRFDIAIAIIEKTHLHAGEKYAVLEDVARLLTEQGRLPQAMKIWTSALRLVNDIYIDQEALIALMSMHDYLTTHKLTELASQTERRIKEKYSEDADPRSNALAAAALAVCAEHDKNAKLAQYYWRLTLNEVERYSVSTHDHGFYLKIGKMAIQYKKKDVLLVQWRLTGDAASQIVNQDLAATAAKEVEESFSSVATEMWDNELVMSAFSLVDSFQKFANAQVLPTLHIALAKALIKAGRVDSARRATSAAEIEVKGTSDGRVRDSFLRKVIAQLITYDDVGNAISLSSQIRGEASAIRASLVLVAPLIKNGRSSEAIETLKNVTQHMDVIGESADARDELRRATAAIVKSKSEKDSLQTLTQLSQDIRSPVVRYSMLKGIAEGLDDSAKAVPYLHLALDAASQVANQGMQSLCFAELAMEYARVGDLRRSRIVAELCPSSRDRLLAYTYAVQRHEKSLDIVARK